jgi:hypothetical protein
LLEAAAGKDEPATIFAPKLTYNPYIESLIPVSANSFSGQNYTMMGGSGVIDSTIDEDTNIQTTGMDQHRPISTPDP